MKRNEEYFLDATKEFDSGERDEALWAQVLVITRGDEERARYIYIDKRAAALKDKSRKDFIKGIVFNLRNQRIIAVLSNVYIVFILWSFCDWYGSGYEFSGRGMPFYEAFGFCFLAYIISSFFALILSTEISTYNGFLFETTERVKFFVIYNIYSLIIIFLSINYLKDTFFYFFPD